jgi:flagellar hook-basal body complex protein FliE
MPIQPINSNQIQSLRGLDSTQKSVESNDTKQVSPSFGDLLASLNQSQSNADGLMQQLAQGENVDLHTVMIGMEENNVNFNVALGIRDRLVEAYREIMRMQV